MGANYKYPMNDEEFKRKLTEVADWHIPEIKLDGTTRRQVRGRLSNETKYQNEHEQIFFEIFGGINPTAVPTVTNIKPAATTCDDCGRHCPNGRAKEKKLYQTGKNHWREKCITCGMNKNPYTGVFDLTTNRATAEWTIWLRKNAKK